MLNVAENRMPTLKVVIQSRNRKAFLRESLASVIDSAKTLPSGVVCEIQVSDNSQNEECVELVKEIYPQIQVISRRPNLEPHDHATKILKEAFSDYLVLFHDDDIMKINFLPHLYQLLTINTQASAVGCNSLYLINGMEGKESFLKQDNSLIIIDTPDKLIDKYFLYGNQSIVPFSSYMYDTFKIKGILPKKKNGNKHADVAFLFEVAQRGLLIWTSEVLMNYRLHESNDNGTVSISSKIGLLRYLRRHVHERKSQALQDFRFSIMLNWFKVKVKRNYNYFQWTASQKLIFRFLVSGVIHRFIFTPGFRLFFLRKFIDYKKIYKN